MAGHGGPDFSEEETLGLRRVLGGPAPKRMVVEEDGPKGGINPNRKPQRVFTIGDRNVLRTALFGEHLSMKQVPGSQHVRTLREPKISIGCA
jgi:hypothetical protein